MNTTPTARTNQTLVLSGVLELAVGALTGWPYALAVNKPNRIGALGIRSVPRLRQWHLDLIALGGLSVLLGSAVPELPRRVAWPLAAGAWTNAHAFGVLAFRPDWKDCPAYQGLRRRVLRRRHLGLRSTRGPHNEALVEALMRAASPAGHPAARASRQHRPNACSAPGSRSPSLPRADTS